MPRKEENQHFHFLLDEPSRQIHDWIGRRLTAIRKEKKKDINAVISAATIDAPGIKKISKDDIKSLEGGQLWFTLGELRDMLWRGYGVTLTQLLHEYFEEHRKELDPDESRPFERDSHYSGRLTGEDKTPFFVGGHPTQYRWAVPFRQLKSQPMVTEFLELPKRRTSEKEKAGIIAFQKHSGIEIIVVINGSIEVEISRPGGRTTTRELTGGQFVHLNASCKHRVENKDRNSHVLVLLVRYMPEEAG